MCNLNWRRSGILISLLLALIVPAGWGIYPVCSASTSILITAVCYNAYAPGQVDEAFRLQNVIGHSVDLTGWSGPSIETYGPTTALAKKGQILYRMTEQFMGKPVTDTNTASSWRV